MLLRAGIRLSVAVRSVAAVAVFLVALVLPAAVGANQTVWSCGANTGTGTFGHAAVFGINTPSACPAGPATSGWGLQITTSGNTVANGQRAYWQANAPAGLVIVGAAIPSGYLLSSGVDDGHQYGGGFYWAGGGANVHDGESSAGFAPLWSSYFGWQMICGKSPSCTANGNIIDVSNIALYVQETTGPTLSSPDGLWQASGWVRGDWAVHFYGDSPSGLCGLTASLNGYAAASSSSGQDQSVWHQCGAPAIDQALHTFQYGEGSMPLTLSGLDAAGEPVTYAKTVYVDNSQPTVTISGPTDAPARAGVQYVTATGGGSPSGIDGFACSVDNAPAQWYPGASAQVPVSGIGEHSVQCSAANNAVDQAGNHAWSSAASWTLKIGEPTVSAVSFANVVDGLHCRQARQRLEVPARWVAVHRGHTRVKVRRRAHTNVVKVMRCHPRTALRRITVWVTIRRRGKKLRVKRTELERVVLTPHVTNSTTRRVAYGQGTTVNGWLGTDAGVALGGQTVTVLSAPDNGQGNFTPAATVTTTANGSWSAQLPAGPSRLVEAAYAGGPTTESSLSSPAQVIVPAEVKLIRVFPGRVPWGGTVRIVGELDGGYLPPDGALVRLRIGSGSAYTTYGVQEHVTGAGRFSTTYTFGAGQPSVHRTFWFQISSLPMGDYPYAPGASGRRSVVVGGHPAR